MGKHEVAWLEGLLDLLAWADVLDRAPRSGVEASRLLADAGRPSTSPVPRARCPGGLPPGTGRVNGLAKRPEFYDTITNNCTTNIVRHIDRVRPNRVAYDVRLLLPGYSDQLAFNQGLIVPSGTFEQTRQRAYINPLAERYADREDFSELIRRR